MADSLSPRRRKRVQRLKRIIVGTVITVLVLPTVIAILLGVQNFRLHKEISLLQAQLRDGGKKASGENLSSGTALSDTAKAQAEKTTKVVTEVAETAVEELEEAKPVRQIYLTFDDGPSARTDKILDILEKYDIKATFFVVGKPQEEYEILYQRIVKEGHTLGMHSYSHSYSSLYADADSFTNDLDKLQEFLYDKTGVESTFYRFPGGSSNTVSKTDMDVFLDILKERKITYFDWNVSADDAANYHKSSQQIIDNCLRGIEKHEGTIVILLHDADDKKSTVEALPGLIEAIKARGDAEFYPITDDTPLIQHRSLSQ